MELTLMNGKGAPSPDTIRASGLAVAEDMRALAAQAKAEGEALAAQAEEVAGAVIAASEEVAARVSAYLQKCSAARAAMQEHQGALKMPLPPEEPKPRDRDVNVIENAQRAVEQALIKPPRPR